METSLLQKIHIMLLAILLPASVFANAADYEDIQTLRTDIENSVQSEIKNENFQGDAAITVSNLDARIKLATCSIPKDIHINSNKRLTSNLSVSVSCNGDSPWSIFVPVKLEIFQQIVVAKRNIIKGETLTADDLTIDKRSTGGIGFGYAQDTHALIGSVLTRNIAQGGVIRLSHLSKPMIVNRGDKLVLASGKNGLQVATPAIAMADGRVGDQIRVRNTQSNRIIEAFVVSEGNVMANR